MHKSFVQPGRYAITKLGMEYSKFIGFVAYEFVGSLGNQLYWSCLKKGKVINVRRILCRI